MRNKNEHEHSSIIYPTKSSDAAELATVIWGKTNTHIKTQQKYREWCICEQQRNGNDGVENSCYRFNKTDELSSMLM